MVVLQMDLDTNQFSAGIEGEPMTSVYWSCQKRPVYLAVSFRRVGYHQLYLHIIFVFVCLRFMGNGLVQ